MFNICKIKNDKFIQIHYLAVQVNMEIQLGGKKGGTTLVSESAIPNICLSSNGISHKIYLQNFYTSYKFFSLSQKNEIFVHEFLELHVYLHTHILQLKLVIFNMPKTQTCSECGKKHRVNFFVDIKCACSSVKKLCKNCAKNYKGKCDECLSIAAKNKLFKIFSNPDFAKSDMMAQLLSFGATPEQIEEAMNSTFRPVQR
jgi:hypothetical protein